MTPLAAEIAHRIQRNGPMPFAAFMSLALYHPQHGYYRSGPRTDWRGDYITSAELDPAFGTLWARAFEQVWEACGTPARFTVVEMGPGEGSFAAAVLQTAPERFAAALGYVCVERSPAARGRQEERLGDAVTWVESLDELGEIADGVVFANEVLDNLPVHLVEVRGTELRELCVDVSPDGLRLVSLPATGTELAGYLQRCGVQPPEGHRFEVGLAAESFARRAAATLQRGVVVLVDYGMEAPALMDRPAGTALAYSAAGADDDLLAAPGTRDITAHVNWTAVALSLEAAGMAVAEPIPQRAVLAALGIADIDASLRAEHDAMIAAGDGAAAIAALSRRQALGALVDRGGLGGLEVLGAWKSIDRPSFLAGHTPERDG